MNKTASVLISLALFLCLGLASCPFSARFDVSWDTSSYRWVVNDDLQPLIEVAGGEINLFNVTSGGGDFFISSSFKCNETMYALGRKDNVTNNACTPPCTIAFKLTTGQYFYCSTLFRDSVSGYLHVLDCSSRDRYRCGSVIGCGWSDSKSECRPCIDASSKKDCEKLSDCSWCPGDEVCLHKYSNACRDQIERDRAVASWVWLLITICALLVLLAIFATLFLSERGFKARWAALSKMDKDFAEVGKGANDGLSATD